MFKRVTPLPRVPSQSFFLWGPRQTGKSTLLTALYPGAIRIDLLKTDEYIRYLERPSALREELEARPGRELVVVDEIQKVTGLLDEIHWLIENRRRTFAMCGSSARKVRRSHANLLGGRAVRYELLGLTSEEIGPDFDLVRMLNHGFLPRHYVADAPASLLRSYVNDYLKEEIAQEGLTRNLPAFSTFLASASLSDGEIVNFSTIARDCGVSSVTVKSYFEILVDTLLGDFLPAYTKRPKRRVIGAPKFYFGDVGVVNTLARRGRLEQGGALFGKAFESWVRHEMKAYSHYAERFFDFSYWRLASGIEVDFIVDDMAAAVEAKSTPRVKSDDLAGLRQLAMDHPRVKRRVIVCLEPKARVTEDGILVLPWKAFRDRLWSGELLG
jgi:predicted AAA+ superfamily ATPase